MYLFEIDQNQNRMHIVLAGQFTESEAKALVDECERRIDEVNSNFHILCDLTALDEFEYDAKLHYRKVMDLCNQTGAEKVVRVYADPMNTYGMSIMSYFHYDKDVKVQSCHSISQALKKLNR